MRYRRRSVILPRPASAGGAFPEAFFTMDISSGAGPTYGFTSVGTGHEAGFDHSFNAGGGVGGRDAVDIVMTPVTIGGAPASDMRCGWGGVSSWPSFTQGEALYCQMYLQHIASDPCDNAVDGGTWEGKEVIIGGDTDSWRIIQAMSDPDWPTNHAGFVGKNIDGYPASTWNDGIGFSDKLILPTSSAFAVQWGCETGATSSADGVFKIWVNNDTYASPTKTSGTNLALDASLMFGEPQMWQSIHPVATGSTLTIRISHVSFSKEFISNFYASM